MTDERELRRYLEGVLLGSLHYRYIDAAAEAIRLVATDRGGEIVRTPDEPLIWIHADTPLDREALPASDLVEGWSLDEFVECELEERSGEDSPKTSI